MAEGNSSNANRYKGEDIDTDGDGKVNDADTLQGNQPADLGNDADGKTIILKNGIFEVVTEKIIGDFENSQDGWTFSSNVTFDTNDSDLNNYSAELSGDSGATIDNSFDLTGYKYFQLRAITPGGNNGSIDVLIDGTVEASFTLSDSWQTFQVDISGFTGSHTIKILETGTYQYSNQNVDNIRLIPYNVIKDDEVA